MSNDEAFKVIFKQEFDSALERALALVSDEYQEEVVNVLCLEAMKYSMETHEALPRPVDQFLISKIPREALKQCH